MQFYGGVDDVRVDQYSYSSSSSLKSLGIPMRPVSNLEVIEVTKNAENAHRYLLGKGIKSAIIEGDGIGNPSSK
jgi:hypothetical protein